MADETAVGEAYVSEDIHRYRFMTNFLMDYMLLRLVGKFLHLDGKRRRCVISAAFGSFVSCLLVCVPFKIIFLPLY